MDSPDPTETLTAEQALWEAHSSLNTLKEKLVLLRRTAPTPRDKYRIDDMTDWLGEATKCLLQIDLLMSRREALRAMEKPKDKRKMAFQPKRAPLGAGTSQGPSAPKKESKNVS